MSNFSSTHTSQILKEDDNNWPMPDRVGRQELEMIIGNEHVSLTCTKLGSVLQVQQSKDPEGLRIFYYLVQVGLHTAAALCTLGELREGVPSEVFTWKCVQPFLAPWTWNICMELVRCMHRLHSKKSHVPITACMHRSMRPVGALLFMPN